MEQDYTQGFNHGYLLAKYAPQLSSTLSEYIHPQPGYIEGFCNGTKEYGLELMQSQLLGLQEIRGRGFERDLDGKEIE